MITEIPAKKTILAPTNAGKYIAGGYRKVVGKSANADILALLIAQWAEETENGNKIFNYNFGNTMPVASDKYFQWLNASEIINGVNTPMREKFAAFLTPEEGAAAYVQVLKSRPHWWAGLQSGTAEGFINGLSTAPKYFTADPNVYYHLMLNRVNQFMPIAVKYASTFWLTTAEVLGGILLGGTVYYGVKKHG